MRDYDKLLEAGNKAQLEKLEENNHKRGFDEIDLDYAYGRIEDELLELKKELYDLYYGEFPCKILKDQYNCVDVRKEAADIANFAHMIILKCDQELEKAF